jgi:hypothetical protein
MLTTVHSKKRQTTTGAPPTHTRLQYFQQPYESRNPAIDAHKPKAHTTAARIHGRVERTWRFDSEHATAPGFTVGFLRTSLLKLSGLARYYLVPAKAEAYSILDDAHQRHADLLLTAEHIEQQQHTMLAIHGHEDSLQLGKAAFGNAYAIPCLEGRFNG